MKTVRLTVIFLITSFFLVGSVLAQGAPVKVGFIGAMTGAAAVMGQRCNEGFLMGWNEFNEKGGAKGRKVEVITDDDEGQAGKGVNAANKQIFKDEILCGFATTNTPVTMAVVPSFQKYGVSHMTQVFGPTVTKMGSKYVFRISVSIDAYAETIYEWAVKNMGLKTVAIFSDKGGFGKDVGDAWEKVAPQYGVKVVTHEKCNLEDKDFTGQLLQIKKLNPQGVVMALGWELTMGLIVKNMKKLGMNNQVFAGAMSVEKYVEYGGEAAEGSIIGLPLVDYDRPKQVAEFASRFRAKYGRDPVLHNVWGYDAANILGTAMGKVAPNITRETVYQGITSVSGVQLVQGTYDFKASQDGIRRSKVAKIQGAKAVLIQE